ncbi:ABC transporter B family member 15 [Acorus calamus]|uniref:ABC transporter B family member 15 n=1 Tax=Acorus calamus TaxID=4465 RepID=A0AAV9ET93_ACOCL|nr:ABC transporter B family member 15 [Acorus calamus]
MDEMKEKKNRSSSLSTASASLTSSSIWSIFMHADIMDMWLMAFGFIGAVGDGFGIPLMLIITSKIMNNLGNTGSIDTSLFTHNVNKRIE